MKKRLLRHYVPRKDAVYIETPVNRHLVCLAVLPVFFCTYRHSYGI